MTYPSLETYILFWCPVLDNQNNIFFTEFTHRKENLIGLGSIGDLYSITKTITSDISKAVENHTRNIYMSKHWRVLKRSSRNFCIKIYIYVICRLSDRQTDQIYYILGDHWQKRILIKNFSFIYWKSCFFLAAF